MFPMINVISFLLSSAGSRIIIGIIIAILIGGLLIQTQCNYINQQNVAQQYAQELTKQKSKALNDKVESLSKKLDDMPITSSKPSFNVFSWFHAKPKDVPKELEDSKNRVNNIGDKCGRLASENKNK